MTAEERNEGAGSFAVELPIFVGPFKLLADLIVDQKVDVCDVPIAVVTDGFLAHSRDAEAWSLEEATWFLAICAILLELKVGRLMPRHEVLDEEDLLGISPDLLYARSIELAAFRTVATELAGRMELESLHHPRDVGGIRGRIESDEPSAERMADEHERRPHIGALEERVQLVDDLM